MLVEWGCRLLQHLCEGGRSLYEEHGAPVIQAFARALDLVSSDESHAKPSLRKSAIVVTRSALRKLVKEKGESGVNLVVETLTVKGNPLGYKSAPLLGILAEACARLDEGRRLLQQRKDRWVAFYLREIVGSRTIVPKHVASALNEFFTKFITISDLRTEILPSMEKAMLRAPEVVLNDLVTPLARSVSGDIDLAPALTESFCKALTSNLKSTNNSIRKGATSAFKSLIVRSHDHNVLSQIAEEVLTPLQTSKLLAESRVLHAQILKTIPTLPQKADSLCERLCGILPKETNESALGEEVAALLNQFGGIVNINENLLKNVLASCTKGLVDKKPLNRRQWILGTGEFLWRSSGELQNNLNLLRFAETCIIIFSKITDEVVQNPLATASNGVAVGALIALVLADRLDAGSSDSLRSEIKKARAAEKVISADVKSSILLNHRVYKKFAEADYVWQIRSLVSSRPKIQHSEDVALNLAWSQAIIHLSCASEVPRGCCDQTIDALGEMYFQSPPYVAQTIVRGLWKWYKDDEAQNKDTVAGSTVVGGPRLLNVLRAICPLGRQLQSSENAPAQERLQDQLIDMLVLCRPEIIPRASWIEVCLRMGQDPGIIAGSRPVECLSKIEECLQTLGSHAQEKIHLACCNAAAELAFVSPNIITPLLVDRVRKDLSVEAVSRCGPTEAAIARTPEGTAFIDVLTAHNQRLVIDKNAPNYETRKWEEEVRSQIAQKKGQQKKLSPEDKAKVEAQIQKEVGIRVEVRRLERNLRAGVGIVQALAVGPPTDASIWMGPSLRSLAGVIEAGAARLIGNAANEAYLACSNLMSSRLASLRTSVGVATLRSLGSPLAENLTQEPLGGLLVPCTCLKQILTDVQNK